VKERISNRKEEGERYQETENEKQRNSAKGTI
jgi:hypothetical protein